MYLYHIVSLTKLILGLGLLAVVYFFVNIYEDPYIGIGLGFLGLFIFIWGVSYFLFLFFQRVFRHNKIERIIKDSYKLSLLFGVYAMINVLLLISGVWSKLLGFVLLAAFIGIQVVLFSEENKSAV